MRRNFNVNGLIIACALLLAACGPDNNISKGNNTNGETNNTNGETNNCINITCNNDAGTFCEGDVAVTLEQGAGDCCASEVSRTDCTASGQVCENGACVDEEDLCALVDCSLPEPTCDGDEAVTYNVSCDPENGACVEEERTRTDCAATNQTCSAGACADTLCANVDCSQPADSCDINTAVTYSGDGVCVEATGECDYSQVSDTTDCAGMAQICVEGACTADDDPTVTPGSLVITEFFYDPTQVSDDDGEWIELYNPTNRTLDLEGLKLIDDGTDEFVISTGAAVELPGRSYFVLGRDTDTAVNGGAPVDLAYGGSFDLSNGDDEIVITDANDVEIDRVAYDTSMDWLDVAGASLQFDADADVQTDDNAVASAWCAGSTPYGDGDSGTPGTANESCAPTTHTIYEISNEDHVDHPTVGTAVAVEGVAVTAIGTAVMWVQEANGGEFSGIAVSVGSVDVSALAIGDIVDLTATYVEDFDRATLVLQSITDSGNDMNVAPELLETSVFADPATAEPWEGVLVQLVEIGVTDDALGNGEIRVDGLLRTNDLLDDTFATTAVNCDVFDMLTGVINYTFSNYKLEPRDANDVGTGAAATQVTDVDAENILFTPQHICVTAGDTVTWTNQDAQAHTVTERIATETAVNANIPATPLFDEQLDANGGTATVTFDEVGTYHYRCRPHPAMEGVVVVVD